MRPLQKNQSTFEELSASQQQDAARITTVDLAYRSLPGTFMYLVGWFFLYFVIQARTDSELTDQWLSLISQIVVIGAVLRVLLVLLARRFIDQINTSRGWLALGVLINSLTWGIMAACASLDTPLTPHGELILLTTAGISAGGAISFSVSRFFTALFLCGMLVPTMLVQIFIVENTDFGTLAAVTLYLAGMYMVTSNPYREYRSALTSNLMLTEMSNTDGLTSLRNRRSFDEQLQEEVQRAQRSGYALTVLLLDIDHFKRINDEHGHPAGDHCITSVAQCLTGAIGRAADTIARYGGEEFAVILPNTGADHAVMVAERIRHSVEDSSIRFEGAAIPLTVSVGCCSVEIADTHTQPEDLIARADKALYAAKNEGRNRVELHHELEANCVSTA